MESSEDQFQQLLAHLIARVNKALTKQNKMPCIGLLLSSADEVEVFLGTSEEESFKDEVDLLQKGLAERAQSSNVIAACLAYPDYEHEEVVAYLENSENFCAKARIPVVSGPTLKLDIENLKVEDGIVFIFGASDT